MLTESPAAGRPAAASAAGTEPLPLEPDRNCWRIARAKQAALIIDAEDYYRAARKAMLSARSQILLIGWDVDTRICLDPDADDGAPKHLGQLLSWLVKERPDLHIHILAWDAAAFKFLGRGSTIFRLAAWARHERVHFKLDSTHPREASHHQKILVIDDCLAFCGGIDMTGSRWDTRRHRDDDPGRRRPTTGRRYPPWHDAIMAVNGEAARVLGDLGRLRWKICTEDELPEACDAESRSWPEWLEPNFEDVELAVARTRGEVEGWSEVREIEALFLDMIAAAKSFLYIENQYFSSRVIAQAVARRLEEPDGPEFVIVCPKTSQGWLDEQVMGPSRAQLMRAVQEHDRYGRFRMYTPLTRGGEDIYVHAKVMIVDDVLLRVGSANLNNRSMGLDSECDLMIDARRRPGSHGDSEEIARIRCDLLAEHLGVEPNDVDSQHKRRGSLIAAVEALRGEGRSLVPFEPPEFNAVQNALAESELMDPESACDKPFEPRTRQRLLSGFDRLRR